MILSVLARGACILIGAFSIFGALFTAHVSPGMVAGFCALVAALIPATRPGAADARSRWMLGASLLGLGWQVADVVVYYRHYAIAGNYYWWPASIFFFVALTLLALHAWRTLPARSAAAR
jgi:hypothetical protein